MKQLSLEGVWAYNSLNFPDYEEFMSIDESRGRIITFAIIGVDPTKYVPVRSWYHRESDTSIAMRLQANQEWQLHEFKFQNDLLLWTYGGKSHSWRRLLPEEEPDWLQSRLVDANAKMDEDESPA